MSIAPMPIPQMPGALDAINAGLAGQSLSQAWESNNMADPYDVGFGVADWTSNKPSISGNTNNTIHDSSEDDPVDAWQDYVENESGNVSQVTGGISDGSGVVAFTYSLLETHPQAGVTVIKAVSPVAIPIAQAAVAVSQTLGVSVDWNSVNDDIKDGFATAFEAAGVLYDRSSGLVNAWWDGVHMLLPKKAVAGVKDFLDEEGIPTAGTSGGGYTSDLDISPATMPVPASAESVVPFTSSGNEYYRRYNFNFPVFKESGYYYCVIVGDSYNQQVTYATGFNSQTGDTNEMHAYVSSQYTYNNKRVFYTTYGVSPYFNNASSIDGVQEVSGSLANVYGAIAWTIKYGEEVSPGEYPEGTQQSQATAYTLDTLPVAGGIATSSTTTEDAVPINLPENPLDTTGSTVDPISPTDEDQVEDLPLPPIPLPIPDTKPSNPAIPLVNPSVVDSTLVEELVNSLANTLDPQPGQSSGIIPIPPLPGILDPETGQTTFPSIIPQSGPGFIHVYNPTPAEFVAFGTWLWVTYADATIDKILNNPFDGVIGAHELYATPNRDGRDNIRSAFLTCPTSADLVTNRYSEIDCGTVIVPEFYGNYLDYSPYSQAYIYLPFIGINEVSIDDIVGHAVNIRYRVDSYSGSCIAMIFVAKDGYQNLCYQFAGSCSVEVPMAGGSQAAIKAGMMQAEAYARAAMIQAGANLVGGIGSGLMGNIGGVLSSLSGIASNYAQAQAGVESARVANKSSVQHSGQFGASHGAMGEKVPFIIIRNPVQVKVVNYNEDYGYPAHKRVIVGGCRGYLRVKEVNVISAHATDEEKMAIEMALKGGVYVS